MRRKIDNRSVILIILIASFTLLSLLNKISKSLHRKEKSRIAINTNYEL